MVRRVWLALGVVFVVLGVFWSGRESTHGLAAFFEHWWCPIPLAVIILGIASVVAARRQSPAL
jgi:hypothetical protein